MKLKDYRPKRCNDTGNCVIHYIVYSVQLQDLYTCTICQAMFYIYDSVGEHNIINHIMYIIHLCFSPVPVQ